MVTGTPADAVAEVITVVPLSSCWQQGIDGGSQARIKVAQSSQVVGGQLDRDAVVDVAPVGMVPARFSQESHLAHEPESLDKITEREITSQSIVAQRPKRQCCRELLSLVRCEQGGHGDVKPGTHPIVLSSLWEDVATSLAPHR